LHYLRCPGPCRGFHRLLFLHSDPVQFDGKPATEVITDHAWLKGEFITGVQQRGAAVINALCDALCEYDVEDMPMPATPLAIWRAMQGPRKTGAANA